MTSNGCSLYDLHCAVYSILKADAQLMSIATDIYNHVPQATATYPYVTIGRVDGNAYLTFDDNGDEMIYNIDIFGKSKTFKDIYDIAFRIKQLLASQEKAISDAGNCCIQSFRYGGIVEKPLKNMEVEGRLLTLEFNVKIL